jgi:alpha-ketoglutarate-dependent taurine dioxygenase
MGICTSILIERIEAIEKRLQKLETKTASDLSQEVVAESATGEKSFDALRNLVNAEPMQADFLKVVNENFDELLIDSEKPNNQDAFTELRAKLEELEQVYKKDLVNLDAGTRTANLSQHREIKIACCRTALLVIKNIREVIE